MTGCDKSNNAPNCVGKFVSQGVIGQTCLRYLVLQMAAARMHLGN